MFSLTESKIKCIKLWFSTQTPFLEKLSLEKYISGCGDLSYYVNTIKDFTTVKS